MTMTPSLVELFMEVRINVLVKLRYNRQISRRMGVKLQNPTHVHELLKVIYFSETKCIHQYESTRKQIASGLILRKTKSENDDAFNEAKQTNDLIM